MSYDITAKTDDTTKSTNWLRNPFGLGRWADTMLGDYQAWMEELFEIAEMIHDGAEVTITN